MCVLHQWIDYFSLEAGLAKVFDCSPFRVDVFSPGPYRLSLCKTFFAAGTGFSVVEGYDTKPFVVKAYFHGYIYLRLVGLGFINLVTGIGFPALGAGATFGRFGVL